MWYTSRQEGFDDPRHSKRQPSFDVGSSRVVGSMLRLGFGLEWVCLSAMCLVYWAYGGRGLFGYDLAGSSVSGRENTSFRNVLCLWAGLYLLGSLYLVAYQAFMADDACWARGYRAGSKILRLATFLDLLSSALQFIFLLYFAKSYTPQWWMHFNNGGSEWTFFAYTRILHSMSFFLFGFSTYLLEVYHDQGAGDLHAYLNGLLFVLAGIAEIFTIFVKMSSISTIFIWAALGAAFLWAIYFEPEVNFASPEMYETELTNDVEQQVEKFARSSPYTLSGPEMANQ